MCRPGEFLRLSSRRLFDRKRATLLLLPTRSRRLPCRGYQVGTPKRRRNRGRGVNCGNDEPHPDSSGAAHLSRRGHHDRILGASLGAADGCRAADPVQPSRSCRDQQNPLPVLPRVCAALRDFGGSAGRTLRRMPWERAAGRDPSDYSAMDRSASAALRDSLEPGLPVAGLRQVRPQAAYLGGGSMPGMPWTGGEYGPSCAGA
jgi:hypothetical protein